MTKVKNTMKEKSHTVPIMAKSLSLMLTIKDNPIKETWIKFSCLHRLLIADTSLNFRVPAGTVYNTAKTVVPVYAKGTGGTVP